MDFPCPPWLPLLLSSDGRSFLRREFGWVDADEKESDERAEEERADMVVLTALLSRPNSRPCTLWFKRARVSLPFSTEKLMNSSLNGSGRGLIIHPPLIRPYLPRLGGTQSAVPQAEIKCKNESRHQKYQQSVYCI
eukprot:3788845-Rhodomonas_salina.1